MGNELFTRAGLARNQNRGIGSGHLLDQIQNPCNGPALPDNFRMAMLQIYFFAQIKILRLEPLAEFLDLDKCRLKIDFSLMPVDGIGDQLSKKAKSLDQIHAPIMTLGERVTNH